jgi:AAA15 family ATPase/GTPase
MIEEFSFGNFRSIKDIQTLNMTAAKIKSINPILDIDNLIPINNKLSLLKSKAIYGANASGKSNVVRALVAFIRITETSVSNETVLSLIDSFKLSSETENEPTFFQLIFRYKEIRYRYGFECNNQEIKSEWLFATPNLREQTLFIRENQKIIQIDKTHYNEGVKYIDILDDNDEVVNSQNDYENPIFRPNSLFLKSVALTGFGKLSRELINSISSIGVVNGLGHQGMYNYAVDSLQNPEMKEFMVNFLKYADVGISDLEVIDVQFDDIENDGDSITNEENISNKRKSIVSKKIRYNANMEKNGEQTFKIKRHESEGTLKLFELSPFIFHTLKMGRTLIIDEFDSRFHPLITKKIIELFNSAQNKNGQLIFITHDTNLLSSELLRKDQIEFVEKDKFGASHLYSLLQFKGIRNNASFEKDYIQGKYGAIPFLGNFSKLLKNVSNA